MNCETIKNLLSEFADERLDAATAWQVQTHLAECEACRQVSRDLAAMRRLLQTLPTQKPSAGFDAALAQRLAMTRRPQTAPAVPQKPTWQEALTRLFAAPKLRPALALGLAGATVAAVALFPLHPTPPIPTPAAVRNADPAFVADCVAQRRRDAAGEPLADFSAQNLAGHLDNSAAEAPSSPGTAEQTADASIF